MRIIGLDVGSKTIGVAVSDEMGYTAQGLETIRRTTEPADLDTLRALVEHYSASEIIIGLPKRMDGSLGPAAQSMLAFAEKVAAMVSAEVKTWDERLSTVAAGKMLIAADVRRKKRRQVIDKVAAVLILQSYLDYRATRPNHP
ncbi:MAG: Holliday junction resolvase RuvX [Pseudomonadota bacterium]